MYDNFLVRYRQMFLMMDTVLSKIDLFFTSWRGHALQRVE